MTEWKSRKPISLKIQNQELQIWAVSIAEHQKQISLLKQLLNPEQIAQAERFHFEADRKRFVLAHGMLRKILGLYLNHAPEKLQFSKNSYGKPSLTHPQTDLQFNISHSGNWVLLAFSKGIEVGVDVEQIRNDRDMIGIALRYFAPEEQAVIKSFSESEQLKRIFEYWVLKEAIIKMVGKGLSFPLDDFAVDIKNFLLIRDNSHQLGKATFKLLPGLDPSYISGIAIAKNISMQDYYRLVL